MVSLDKEWFAKYGIKGLTTKQIKLLADAVYKELETRVGTRIAAGMTDAQLDEYSASMGKSEDEQLVILNRVCPDYKQIVRSETEALGEEIKNIGNKEAFI